LGSTITQRAIVFWGFASATNRRYPITEMIAGDGLEFSAKAPRKILPGIDSYPVCSVMGESVALAKVEETAHTGKRKTYDGPASVVLGKMSGNGLSPLADCELL